ncbi:MAG: hypothetical protein E5Y55_00920 [Mesorhizobium sp.]|uniref:hypothetical protein n=1 Tax=Mesorhizobium sp. TaxID=1871066 RepID=UPI00122A0F8F|nr:hypothetical protein [Mesorhizobium sp.]TIM48957.1 MAG: hypothetical protein E5Y55_00920 [Mesorhizobium sp.]
MTGGSDTAKRDMLLARRLDLIANVSALTAEALRLDQKRAGIEMEVLRLELEIGRSGASAQLVQDLHEAEERAAAVMQEGATCEQRIAAAEGEVEEVDLSVAATVGN